MLLTVAGRQCESSKIADAAPASSCPLIADLLRTHPLAFAMFASFEKLLERLGIAFKELREVRQNIHGRGTKVMLDAFDVLPLSAFIETEE